MPFSVEGNCVEIEKHKKSKHLQFPDVVTKSLFSTHQEFKVNRLKHSVHKQN